MAHDPNAEIRLQYERDLGLQLGGVYAELWQELTWLNHVWQEYRVIFATTPEQLDLFNKAAGGFFFMVHKVMWEAIILHLARLLDPPNSARKPNLSMTRLTALVREDLQDEVRQLIETAREKAAFAFDWRNRFIAHKDLNLALGELEAPPLASASRASVTAVLDALGDVLNAVDLAYCDRTTSWEPIEPLNGASALLRVIKEGFLNMHRTDADDRRRWGIPPIENE